MIREFWAGAGTLARGFGLWRTHPRLLALGLVPAVLTFFVLLAALIPLGIALGSITAWMTPFADDWIAVWRDGVRIVLGAVLFVAATILSGLAFTAMTLTVGDPFYQRIWRDTEHLLGGAEPTGQTGFWATVGEGVRLLAIGILIAVLTVLIGIIPVIGGPLAAITGVVLSGRVLARELTSRAFDARGVTTAERSRLLRDGRARTLGFGIATQLCFLVPFGAVITMPAAVAGSTMLARALTERTAPTERAQRTGGDSAPVPHTSPAAVPATGGIEADRDA